MAENGPYYIQIGSDGTTHRWVGIFPEFPDGTEAQLRQVSAPATEILSAGPTPPGEVPASEIILYGLSKLVDMNENARNIAHQAAEIIREKTGSRVYVDGRMRNFGINAEFFTTPEFQDRLAKMPPKRKSKPKSENKDKPAEFKPDLEDERLYDGELKLNGRHVKVPLYMNVPEISHLLGLSQEAVIQLAKHREFKNVAVGDSNGRKVYSIPASEAARLCKTPESYQEFLNYAQAVRQTMRSLT